MAGSQARARVDGHAVTRDHGGHRSHGHAGTGTPQTVTSTGHGHGGTGHGPDGHGRRSGDTVPEGLGGGPVPGAVPDQPGNSGGRAEDRILALTTLLLGGMSFAASFQHVLAVAVRAGQRDWVAWEIAASIELMALCCGLEARRRRKRNDSVKWPLFGLLLGVAMSLAANLSTAGPGPWGAVMAAWPQISFLVVVGLVETRRSTRTPGAPPAPPVPVPAERAAPAVPSPAAVPVDEVVPVPVPAERAPAPAPVPVPAERAPAPVPVRVPIERAPVPGRTAVPVDSARAHVVRPSTPVPADALPLDLIVPAPTDSRMPGGAPTFSFAVPISWPPLPTRAMGEKLPEADARALIAASLSWSSRPTIAQLEEITGWSNGWVKKVRVAADRATTTPS